MHLHSASIRTRTFDGWLGLGLGAIGATKIVLSKNRSMLSTLICPYIHTKNVLVCVLGQISVLNMLLFLQCI